MKRLIKRYLLLASLVFTLFSCTTKEEKVREFVEQNVVSNAEDYMICQAIIKYVQNDALEIITDRFTYYANNPYYDYSYFERDLGGPFMALASSTGGIKKLFDERWYEFMKLYSMFSYREDIEESLVYMDDGNLELKDLINEYSAYSIEEIAEIYSRPNHLKFTEITPELFETIYRSVLCLGAATYKYDAVDEIRVKEKEKNLWIVDLIYHSGYCMNLEITKEDDFYVLSKVPWILEWDDEYDFMD